MTEKTPNEKMQERQDGDYKPPILQEPTVVAPVPKHRRISSR